MNQDRRDIRGRTGNVSGCPRLHFGVFTVTHPNRLVRGRELNPCALLTER